MSEAFEGVWRRVSSENYGEIMRAMGCGLIARRLAATLPARHTIIVYSEDHVRLLEQIGPISTDSTFDSSKQDKTIAIAGQSFSQRCFWNEPTRDQWIIRRTKGKDYYLDAARSLVTLASDSSIHDDDTAAKGLEAKATTTTTKKQKKMIRLDYTHVKFSTGKKTTAVAFFEYAQDLPPRKIIDTEEKKNVDDSDDDSDDDIKIVASIRPNDLEDPAVVLRGEPKEAASYDILRVTIRRWKITTTSLLRMRRRKRRRRSPLSFGPCRTSPRGKEKDDGFVEEEMMPTYRGEVKKLLTRLSS